MQHDVQPLSLANLHGLSAATASSQFDAKHQRINSHVAAVIGMCSKLSTASQGLAVVSGQRLFGMCTLCLNQDEYVVGLVSTSIFTRILFRVCMDCIIGRSKLAVYAASMLSSTRSSVQPVPIHKKLNLHMTRVWCIDAELAVHCDHSPAGLRFRYSL
jgi:hypothetical protein